MNYLITGFPGMGKSTIATELKKRGHIAYDPQKMHSYMHTESRLSGRHIKAPAELTRGWYDTIGAFNWNPVKIHALMSSSNDVFICSMAHNQNDFLDKFQLVFVLALDDAELEHRLRVRLGQSIGKTPEELSDITTFHRHFEQSLLNHGAIRINASHTMNEIVDLILGHVQNNK